MPKIWFLFKFRPVFLTAIVFIIAHNLSFGQAESSLKRHEYTHSSMGSLFRIICYGEDSMSVKRAVKAAFAEIDSLNLILSDYLSYSELMELSRTAGSGEYQPVSKDLFNVVSLSKKWSERSEGAFDISIGAITQLWRRASFKEEYPDSSEVNKALDRVGYQLIKTDSSRQAILLKKKGMMLDAGGIAKGYAVDRAIEILNDHGYTQCLVDGAGDIRVGYPPPDKEGWLIAMENFSGIDSSFVLSNKAIAGSGDLYRYIEVEGKRYSHIIDPDTGYGLTVRRNVTVIADTGTKADVLASILSVMGPEKGCEFLNKTKGVRALILENKNGKTVKYNLGP